MTEEHELEVPGVADVPEPDQEPHEPPSPEDEEHVEEEAAEAEEPSEEPAEPSEPQARSAFDDPDRRKKVERSFDTYTAMVNKQYEEEALSLIRCPLCPDNFPGFVHPNDFGRYPEQVKATIMEVLGFAREQSYEPDPDAVPCPVCKRKGFTSLPSDVPGESKRVCRRCGGHGWLDRAPQNGTITEAAEGHVPTPAAFSAPLSSGPVDMWAEPEILPNGAPNPNYGKLPDHKVLVEPWGVTAGLTAQDATA